MKHYIFIMAMMLNVVALHAQEMSIPQLMEYLQELYKVRHQLASVIGDRVVNPK